MKKSLKYNYKNLIIYIILIIFAILISLQSSISPIYSNGYISIDVSVWTNIANRMSHGQIMYKDFFDHKGPILYFLYYLGYLFGEYLGIWMLDLICNIINVLIIYKISKLILKNKVKSLIVVAICTCFMCGLCIENPCTESLSLPIILISLYEFTKYTLNIKKFSRKESLCTGICFAIVLLLRPNIATLWVVYYIYIFVKLVREKEVKHLIQVIVFSITGVIIVFLPIILYLIKNTAFIDFINTYIVFNFKYANNKESSIIEVIQYFIIYTNYIIVLIVALYIGLINMKRKLNKVEYQSLKVSFIYFIFTFYMAVMPQRIYLHYLITILPTLIVPLAIYLKYMKTNKKIDTIIIIVSFLLCLVLSVYNITLQLYKQSNYISYFKEISDKVQELTEKEDNVLTLGNSSIVYLMSDRNYKGKYLYQTPIVNQNEEIFQDVIKEIKNDLPNLIVNSMTNWDVDEITIFEQEIKRILDENYITDDEIIYIKK